MTDQIRSGVGEIWEVGLFRTPALVVCVFDDGRDASGRLDVRVVPLSVTADAAAFANDHDVLIPAADFSLIEDRAAAFFVAHAWLGEPVPEADLVRQIGKVNAACLSRVQAIELLGLGPVSEDAYREFRGRYRIEDPNGANLSEMTRVVTDWRANLTATRDFDGWNWNVGSAPMRGSWRDMLAHFAIRFSSPVPAAFTIPEMLENRYAVTTAKAAIEFSEGDKEFAQAA